MTTPRDRDLDRLLDDDGGEFGALYRRLPRAEPPRRLDRAVLGNAARAVRGQTPRRHRWVMALGSAAGVVLAAGIAWHVGQDALREQSLQEGTRGAPVVVPIKPITQDRRRHSDAMLKTEATVPAPMPAEPEPPAKPEQPKKAAPEVRARQAPARAVVRQTPPLAAPMSTPTPFPAAPTPRMNAAPAAPAAAMAPALESSPVPSAQTSDAREQATPSRMRGSGAPAPSSSVELRRDMQLAPDDWVAHIHQLLRQGRRQQAIESLRLFRNAHPQYPLSTDLQALLE